MTRPVSQKTEDALRAAMMRLLEGTSVHTDGRLTVANLAREAGVSRATANRATAVLAEFRGAEARFRSGSVAGLKERIRELEADLRAARSGEMAELRATILARWRLESAFGRNHPVILALGIKLGLDDTTLDQIFGIASWP